MANPPVAPDKQDLIPGPRISGWQRQVQRWASPPWISLGLAPLLHALDRFVLWLTRDRTCLTTLTSGIPVSLVRTRGARSGTLRARPLTALPFGDRLGLIASNFGRPRHPGWFHNLRQQPGVEVRIDGQWRRYSARAASAPERDQIWGMALSIYPGYGDYQRRAAPRRIPVVVLEPQAPSPE